MAAKRASKKKERKTDEEAPTAELVMPLPGETKIEKGLIKQAIKTINSTTGRAELAAALEVGDYLLNCFFSGNIEAYADREGEHTSFNRLAKEKDLAVSAQWLRLAIRVTGQYASLPEDVRDRLPLSHHKLLLPLRDDTKRTKLATQAADGEWSKRQLEARLAKARGERSGAGRPRIPGFVKGLDKLDAMVELFAQEVDWEDPFRGYSDENARTAREDASTRLAEAEQKLKDMLKTVKDAKRHLAKLESSEKK